MRSEFIFKDTNLIFLNNTFFNITESTNHCRFHFGTFLLGACGAKDPKNTKNMSSDLIFKDINMIFLRKLFEHNQTREQLHILF